MRAALIYQHLTHEGPGVLIMALAWAFSRGAGEGNRTPTVSLGS